MSDTVKFQCKNITNPTLSHADKLMQAIYKCSNLIEGKSNEQAEAAIKDMERLIELT